MNTSFYITEKLVITKASMTGNMKHNTKTRIAEPILLLFWTSLPIAHSNVIFFVWSLIEWLIDWNFSTQVQCVHISNDCATMVLYTNPFTALWQKCQSTWTIMCHLRFSPSLLNTAALNLPFHSSGGHSGSKVTALINSLCCLFACQFRHGNKPF